MDAQQGHPVKEAKNGRVIGTARVLDPERPKMSSVKECSVGREHQTEQDEKQKKRQITNSEAGEGT